MVVAYLEGLAGKAQDRGWSLILPASRRAYDSREQYIELATGADWDGPILAARGPGSQLL